jgi:hypothetical protein
MAFSKIQNYTASVGQPTRYDKTRDRDGEFGDFVTVSVALTGFSAAELHSTGMVQTYFEEMAMTVGRPIRWEYLKATLGDPGAALTDDKWKPMAQNVIRLWYLGQWKALPDGWAKAYFDKEMQKGFNEFGRDADRVISTLSYQEGLVWRAIGVNPPGAKQPGFASWTRKLS